MVFFFGGILKTRLSLGGIMRIACWGNEWVQEVKVVAPYNKMCQRCDPAL